MTTQVARNAKYRARRREMLRAIKVAAGCMDCGYAEHGEALDFDHRPEEDKLFEISALHLNPGMDKLMAEVAKCDVVCANCHRVRTARRRLS